jgi:histidyl-tRNA synthetase
VFKIPRGTRDFTPDEMIKRKYVEKSIRMTFEEFGYREIQTPIFENLDLFTAKSGEQIIEEIYSFKDKSGRELALRPELTAPVIRFYVDKLQMNPKPLKLFYLGNCYRYDRPQKGRYREFEQAGCELIGTDTPEALAELIALSYNILRNIGLKDIKLNIGNLNILSSIFRKLNLSKQQQKQLIPLIDKMMFDEINEILTGFGVPSQESEAFLEILKTNEIKIIEDYIKEDIEAEREFTKLKEIFDLIQNIFQIRDFQIKMSIVRGLDYYKGVVFEIDAPHLGAEKQLCGGGLYDLISMFGGRETATSGFAIGFDRSILALESEEFDFKPLKIDAYVIPYNEDMIRTSLKISKELREAGIKTDIDLLRRGIGKSMRYADSINAEKVIIVGPREIEDNSVTIRDMTTGKQEIVKIENIKKILS